LECSCIPEKATQFAKGVAPKRDGDVVLDNNVDNVPALRSRTDYGMNLAATKRGGDLDRAVFINLNNLIGLPPLKKRSQGPTKR
jgi:hypothetical protein